MLVVFEFESRDHLEEFLHIAKHRNEEQNEEMDYCLAREKAQEVIACRELRVPYVVLAKPSIFAKPGGDSGQEIIDCNVDIEALSDDTSLVIRAANRRTYCKALERFQPFVSEAARHDIAHWPSIVRNPEKYLKRHVTELPVETFNKVMRAQGIVPPLFIKGVEKGSGLSLHHVVQSREELDGLIKPAAELREMFGTHVPHEANDDDYLAFKVMPDWDCPYRGPQKGRVYFFEPKDGVMLSNVLKFDHQPDHKAEYRCFIVDGKVSSISTYTDYTAYPVPECIEALAQQFAAEHADLAPAFVADFGMTDRGPVLVELNDFSQSGRYIANDAYALYCDLESLLGADRSTVKEPTLSIPTFLASDLVESVSKDSGESNLLKLMKSRLQEQDEISLG